MTRERYSQWMEVWRWFQGQRRSRELEVLCDMLNKMWQEDRQATPDWQLAQYSESLRIEHDPEFKKFLQDLDKGFPDNSPDTRAE